MLDETAPDGIVYAYADYALPEDYWPVHNKSDMKILYPPSVSIVHLQGDRDGNLPRTQ